MVDPVNGSDGIASRNGYPFKTVEHAVSNSTAGDTVWIMPGTYNLCAGLSLHAGTCIRGLNVQTCTLQMSNVSTDTILINMSQNCRVEDLNLKLQSTGHHSLTGVLFRDAASRSSKIRTCVITVDNSGAGYEEASDVYGVSISGTSLANPDSFSLDCIRSTTVNVYSDGSGNKRGIFVNQSGASSIRETNVFVIAPRSISATGSYVGVETFHSNALFYFKTCSMSGPVYTSGNVQYSYSDIMQTNGTISVGPGTDLINKTAGGKAFETYVYPTTLFYGLKGSISNAAGSNGYLWVGSMPVQKGSINYPDKSRAWYRIQQNALLIGMLVDLSTAPGTNHSISGNIIYERVASPGVISNTGFSFLYENASYGQISNYAQSVVLRKGDRLGVEVGWSSANSAHDLTIELDMF